MKKNLNRAILEFKNGWSLSKLPYNIEFYEKKLYIKIIKFIGAFCVFLIVSGIARQFHKLVFYYIVFYSILFSLYRLMIGIYLIKEFFVIIFSGKLLVRNDFDSVQKQLNSEIQKIKRIKK